MIAIDTSSMRRYLAGENGPDVVLVVTALRSRRAALPPIVVTELLSEQSLESASRSAIARAPQVPLIDGYWERAGLLRAALRRSGFKARVADCLVAQACIDHDIPLITFDRDFRHFADHGLVLLAQS